MNLQDPSSNVAVANEQLTVFVIEDDNDMRRSLENSLQEAGHAVSAFASPSAFLEYYRPKMRGCLVLDLQLPGMSGLELQAALQESGCQLPFIMITGFGDVPRVIEAFRRGAVDFIEKPFRSEQLLSRVEQALQDLAADTNDQQRRAAFAELCQRLTPRERELMDLLVAGCSTKQAAREMKISPKTAYVHRAQVLDKMRVESVSQLVHRVRDAS